MKVLVMLISVSIVIFEVFFTIPKVLCILVPSATFSIVAIIFTFKKKVSRLNELPNMLRVFLASIGATLVGFFSPFHIISGVLLVALGFFANDEALRRLYRQKGVIVLTGIDATGKSTHADNICEWLESRGKICHIVKFHKYLFLDKLSKIRRFAKKESVEKKDSSHPVPPARTSRFSFVRPYFAFIDNFLLYFIKVFCYVVKDEYVVCDRFIWDNYVKHKALQYNTVLLFRFVTLIKPKIGIVFDVPSEVAFERVEGRKKHYRYSITQYEVERREFSRIGRMVNYPIITTNQPLERTWKTIETYLESKETKN